MVSMTQMQAIKVFFLLILLFNPISFIKYYFTESNPKAVLIILPEKIYFGLNYKF